MCAESTIISSLLCLSIVAVAFRTPPLPLLANGQPKLEPMVRMPFWLLFLSLSACLSTFPSLSLVHGWTCLPWHRMLAGLFFAGALSPVATATAIGSTGGPPKVQLVLTGNMLKSKRQSSFICCSSCQNVIPFSLRQKRNNRGIVILGAFDKKVLNGEEDSRLAGRVIASVAI